MTSLLRPQLRSLRACRPPYCARHTSTTPPREIPPLPPHDEWRATFNTTMGAVRDRISVANPDTADILAKAFLTGNSIAAGHGKTVIECYPGPGALSRGLLRLDDKTLERLIILEDWEPYLEYLRPLEQADPRVTVVPLSGFSWSTYAHIEEKGLLDHIKTVPYEQGMHPQLHFVSHIPQNISGEQFVAQLFRNIPTHSWLFKYGCVPMSFIMGEWIWERVAALRKTIPRCKVSVVTEATADMQAAVRPSVLQPYAQHLHPRPTSQQLKKPESRRIGHPLAAINTVPYAEQVIAPHLLDAWDYCLRKLFVLKSTPLNKAISALGPGADSLLRVLTAKDLPPEQRVDVTQKVRDMSVSDWALLIRAFDNWPFAPENLVISDAFLEDRRDRSL